MTCDDLKCLVQRIAALEDRVEDLELVGVENDTETNLEDLEDAVTHLSRVVQATNMRLHLLTGVVAGYGMRMLKCSDLAGDTSDGELLSNIVARLREQLAVNAEAFRKTAEVLKGGPIIQKPSTEGRWPLVQTEGGPGGEEGSEAPDGGRGLGPESPRIRKRGGQFPERRPGEN